MGIDIYARWSNQREEEVEEQGEAWLAGGKGHIGYLREAYHGGPYATEFLCAEAFETGEARIPAAVLKERLAHTLTLAEERERTVYHSTVYEIEKTKQSYSDFVTLCESKENENGEPVLIVAWS